MSNVLRTCGSMPPALTPENRKKKGGFTYSIQEDMLRIEGYVWPLSVKAGERIGFHISTNADRYSIQIARVGAQRHVVWTQDGLTGAQHPVPCNASTHGCQWPVAKEISVPVDWPSGYYNVIMQATGRDGSTAEGQAFFVVRSPHPGRDAAILIQLTTNTYNAYNTWGGSSLYRGPDGPGHRVSFERPYAGLPGVDGLLLFCMDEGRQELLEDRNISERLQEEFQKQVAAYNVPGIRLSTHGSITTVEPGRHWRIDDNLGTGPAAYHVKLQEGQLHVYDGTTFWGAGWRNWEQPFVAWAEQAGYSLDFAINGDLEFHHDILEHYRLVLSVGHDEYWSSPMRDHLESYIAAGGNVAFFSENVMWWQVRSQDNGRALVCWKGAYRQDPVYQTGDHRKLSTLWCHRLINRPENYLTGVSFAYGGYAGFFDQFVDEPGAYTIHRPDHWIFEGTGLKRHDLLGVQDSIVSYECDGCEFELHDGLPIPTQRDGTPETFQILGTASAGLTDYDDSIELVNETLHPEGGEPHPYPGAAVLGTYSRGGTVVTVGCTSWANGLRGGDRQVERVTRNILDRLSS